MQSPIERASQRVRRRLEQRRSADRQRRRVRLAPATLQHLEDARLAGPRAGRAGGRPRDAGPAADLRRHPLAARLARYSGETHRSARPSRRCRQPDGAGDGAERAPAMPRGGAERRADEPATSCAAADGQPAVRGVTFGRHRTRRASRIVRAQAAHRRPRCHEQIHRACAAPAHAVCSWRQAPSPCWRKPAAAAVPAPATGGACLASALAVAGARHGGVRDARRLADQASFGATEALVADIRTQGRAAWVATQMGLSASHYVSGGGDAQEHQQHRQPPTRPATPAP